MGGSYVLKARRWLLLSLDHRILHGEHWEEQVSVSEFIVFLTPTACFNKLHWELLFGFSWVLRLVSDDFDFTEGIIKQILDFRVLRNIGWVQMQNERLLLIWLATVSVLTSGGWSIINQQLEFLERRTFAMREYGFLLSLNKGSTYQFVLR